MDNSWNSDEFLFGFEGRFNRAKYWYALYAGPGKRSPREAPNWDQLRELEFVRRGAGPSPGEHVKRGHD